MNDRLKYVWWDAIMSESGPRSTVRLVMAALFKHMAGDGSKCFPSIPLLAAETALHRATVLEAIREAKADGWIAVDKRPRSGQRGGAYSYYHPLFPSNTVPLDDVNKHPNTVAEDDGLEREIGRPAHKIGRPECQIGRPECSNTVAEDDPSTPSKSPEKSPMEISRRKSPSFAIALDEEIPPEWTPPDELTEPKALFDRLTPDELRMASREILGHDMASVGPRDLEQLRPESRRQLEYAVWSRNGQGPS